MKLLTKAIEESLPALGATEGQGGGALVLVKLFTPDGSWTWYATEYDPAERQFFGLVDGDEVELGYFDLDELEQSHGRMGLPIEMDLYFTPKPLRDLHCCPDWLKNYDGLADEDEAEA